MLIAATFGHIMREVRRERIHILLYVVCTLRTLRAAIQNKIDGYISSSVRGQRWQRRDTLHRWHFRWHQWRWEGLKVG